MGSNRWISTLIFSLVVALFVPVAALAQTASATILGVVTDETGGVLPGVEVSVTNLDRGTTRTVITDDEGRYRAPEVELGSYEVSASLTGFQTAVRSGITMTVGRQAVVDLVLSIGEITERVIVTGEAPTVDTTTSTISGLVDAMKIRDLPLNGRSFTDLAVLQMGVMKLPTGASNSASGFGTKISISGARPSANSFLLDGNFINGTLNNTPGGATGHFLGVETLREFSVLTNNFSAEYGQSMGAIINAVTKSGTNEVHGSAFFFHRNDNLDARNFFDPGEDPPEFRRHQFGFTLGGPIVPNKTFIFGGYEGLRESLGKTLVFGTLTDEAKQGLFPIDNPVTDPSDVCKRINDELFTGFVATFDAALNKCRIPLGGPAVPGGPSVSDWFRFLPPPNSPVVRDPANGIGEGIQGRNRIPDEDNFVVKVDHSFSDSDSMFGRYTFDDATVQNELINFSTGFVTRNQYLTLEEKHIFSPTLLNVARVGYNRSALLEKDFPLEPFGEELQLVPTNRSALPEFQSGLLGTWTPPGTGAGSFVAPIGGSTVTPRIYRTNLFEYSDTLTWTSGRHSVKLGANLKRVQANMISPQRTFGSFQFGPGGIFDFLTGAPRNQLSFITQDSNVQRGIRFWAMGFFVQDDLQISPNLTLNLGLRYEPSTGHSEVNGKLGTVKDIRTQTKSESVEHIFDNPTEKNFAPRIGFAWDPFGDGKTAVRAGFGLFYNIQMAELDRISATSNPPFTTIATVDGLPFPYDFEACCVGGTAGRPSLELIDFNAPQSYMMQWNLNVQRELFPETTLTVGYVGSRGVDLFRVYQWNQPDPVDPSECQPDDGPTCVNPDPGRSPFYYPAFGDRPDSTFLFGGRIPPGRTCPKGGRGFFRCPRLNPNFDTSIQRSGGADSWYHGLQLSLNKRFSKGFQVQVSYNWSHSLDTSSKQIRGPGESSQTHSQQNPLNTPAEKGHSNFDLQHNFTLNYTVDLPGQNMAGAAGKVLGGWQLGGIVNLASGVPESVVLGYDNCRCLNGEIFGVSTTDNRPDLIPGGDNNPILSDGREPTRYFDSSQFVPAPAGFYGQLGRNTLRIPGIAQFDLSFVKKTMISEEVSVQFRSEFFNIFNRANFADPSTRLFFGRGRPNRGVGRINRTSTTSRQIQFALKFLF
ncbi:TonB-dependent receptor [Acidobacteria bacterium AH-259-D05]|nr:TonB-dependent receptor [Acidobacteria bacterium AH-259-D05]